MAIVYEGGTDHPRQPRIEDEESDQRWDKNRVETFSDAVFALGAYAPSPGVG